VTLLDEALRGHDFREHHARYIDAPPEHVDEAVRAVTIRDMPLARLLFALRAAPARLRRKPTRFGEVDAPLLGLALDVAFGPLGDDPGNEVVIGMIGQPWKLVGGESRRFERPEEFMAFAEPGFVKAAMNFRFEPAGAGTRVTTETRVLATDSASRRSFRRYWLVIRPGSGLTRSAWLRAAARRAKHSSNPRPPSGTSERLEAR
jgi:hypothetical protein